MSGGVGCRGGQHRKADRRKVQNIRPHAALGETHSVLVRFLQRLAIIPTVMLDAIAGNDGSSAVFPAPAMHEDFLVVAVHQEPQNLPYLIVGRSAELAKRDIHIFHLQRFHHLLLEVGLAAGLAQIDDERDVQGRQFLERSLGGLPAAIQMVVHLAKISNVPGGGVVRGKGERKQAKQGREGATLQASNRHGYCGGGGAEGLDGGGAEFPPAPTSLPYSMVLCVLNSHFL